jgi:hypothetical protein
MSSAAGAGERFGIGPLSRAAAFVYTMLAVEVLVLLTAGPGLVVLVLLDRDASNLPLVAVCALPAGPALSAALYALDRRRLDLTDLHPAAAFWRGYRLNAKDALVTWAGWLVWITVLGMSLTNLSAAGLPRWWAVPIGLVAVAATLWGLNALVIASLFAFRARDVARLAAYFLARSPGTTVGNLCLLIVGVGVLLISSEAVLALLASLFLLALLRNCRPMIALVRKEFTA